VKAVETVSAVVVQPAEVRDVALFSWIFLGIFEKLATGPFGSYTIPAIE
jgi:hypothetical protein